MRDVGRKSAAPSAVFAAPPKVADGASLIRPTTIGALVSCRGAVNRAHIFLRRLVILCLACVATPALASDYPILDTAAIPHLSARGRASFANFLMTNLPRALAVASNGSYGWVGGGAYTEEAARTKAMQSCTQSGGTDCAIYVDGLNAEWPGVQAVPQQAAPGPLVQGSHYAFVPDARFIWRGPKVARGVIVWGHGKGGEGTDLRGLQPPPLVRAFNNAGFDVVRFDREPFQDNWDYARDWLTDGLAQIRRQGYRTVISGGQSRGGFDALWMLRTPGLVDGVVAVAAGGYGPFLAEFNRALYSADSPAARVVVAQFADDIYESTDLDARTRDLNRVLGSHVGAVMVIDRPTGFNGHFAGGSLEFAIKFAACIIRFVTDPIAPTTCGGPSG